MLTEAQLSSPPREATASNPVIQTTSADRLNEIRGPATSLVVWNRRIPPAVYRWLSKLPPDQLPRGRVLSTRRDIAGAVDSFFEMREARDEEMAQQLAQDIVKLALLYADLAKSDQIDIRLEAIQHDACWKFHLDQVALRMVTTYIGDSTQYVAQEYSEQALREQRDYVGPIEEILEQSVAIFKGARGAPGAGVVHRSPPIKGSGKTRLFLCINGRSNASPELWKPGMLPL